MEAADTLMSLAWGRRRIERSPSEGSWFSDKLDRLRRRWRVWGSACRAEVEDFIWRAIPEDAGSIPAVDLMPLPGRRASSCGRPERFLPLEMLAQMRRVEAMTLRELQVCMQLHGIRSHAVTSEAEARVRLNSGALLLAKQKRERRRSVAGVWSLG